MRMELFSMAISPSRRSAAPPGLKPLPVPSLRPTLPQLQIPMKWLEKHMPVSMPERCRHDKVVKACMRAEKSRRHNLLQALATRPVDMSYADIHTLPSDELQITAEQPSWSTKRRSCGAGAPGRTSPSQQMGAAPSPRSPKRAVAMDCACITHALRQQREAAGGSHLPAIAQ